MLIYLNQFSYKRNANFDCLVLRENIIDYEGIVLSSFNIFFLNKFKINLRFNKIINFNNKSASVV